MVSECPFLGRFPFPREKGTEKGTKENVAGAEWKTRHLAEVWFYVWFERGARTRSSGGLRGRGYWNRRGSSTRQVPKNGSLFGRHVILRGAFLTPFSPFYKISSSVMFEIREISNGEGMWACKHCPFLLCEPRSRGASHRAPDLAPSAEVGWFLLLEGGRTKFPRLLRAMRRRGGRCGFRVPFPRPVPSSPRRGN